MPLLCWAAQPPSGALPHRWLFQRPRLSPRSLAGTLPCPSPLHGGEEVKAQRG